MAKILVVDDEPQIRMLVQRLLTLHGHRVDAAEDGNKALDLLGRTSYDLAIVDHAMPAMSGVDLVGIIRTSPGWNTLRVLMFSGGGVTQNVDAAFEAGADSYILKPFDAARLLAKVASVLRFGGAR